MEFDEQPLKDMAAAKWLLGPPEWLVRWCRSRASMRMSCRLGDTTEVPFWGERRKKWSGSSGSERPSWRRERLCCGLAGCQIGREFALRGYTRYPSGQRYDGHGGYPSGLEYRSGKCCARRRWASGRL